MNMHKNLIIFHLESLSNIIFQNNENLFPNLKKFAKECCQYSNYYSTSTSTFMVMADLVYGDETVFEKSKNYSVLKGNDNREKNLFEELSLEGYYSEVIAPPFLSESECQRYIEIFGGIDKYFFADSYKSFRQEIEKAIQKESFAIYITEFISHISYSKYREEENSGWSNNWKNGYKMLDDLFGFLLNLLNEKSVLDRTMIVAYGDHGDDFYTHKFNGGFTHAIEPYSSMIRTPLFIYCDGKVAQKSELISTVDLRRVVCNLLIKKSKAECPIYVYSRNLYTAQIKENNGLNKAFSVSNGEYLLMVSSKGLELYNINMDPNNGFNILNLFRMKKGKLKRIRNINLISNSHYEAYIIRDDFYQEIQAVYEELNEQLKQYIFKMYSSIGDRTKTRELNFRRINYINKIRYYRIIENYINLIMGKLGFRY